MSKKITIYIGSFKPPHKGHLNLVHKMLDMTESLDETSIESGIVYIFISKKEREPCSKLTGEISKEIWEDYIETLPKNKRGRVKLILSKKSSPTQTAYGFVKNIAKKGYTFYLVKSVKDAENKRFSSFKTIKKNGSKIYQLILPGYKNLNSTHMREFIASDNKKEFYNYLPKMSIVKKKKIWLKLKKLCI